MGESGSAIYCRALLIQHAQNKHIHKEEEEQRLEESEEDGSECSEVWGSSRGRWIRGDDIHILVDVLTAIELHTLKGDPYCT